ncbi:MAG: hydroxysqualene dehydroxylase HpnE [Dehalococcoidia bacterium]|nr:hydroxysqualene dehydroxylase HpnE [Dehalococcoidia bacterium]MCB9486828.1 FAD-dependent oxidoreductase [Thermoflexaceae bacterium]
MNIAVIGGGLAGLAAACELVDLGHRPTIFERRPWAGGKTYSYVDRETGDEVDNGQHVFMQCTTAYTDFLRKLGTLGLCRRQRRLSVPVFNRDGSRSTLRASGLPAPLHLGWSFLRYKHIAASIKPGIARTLLKAARMSEQERASLHERSLGDWLRENGQGGVAIRDFWDFMLVPTLNASSEESSAADALFVLREGFLRSNHTAAIGVARCGLTRLHVDPAVAYFTARGGSIRTGTTVTGLRVRDGRITGLRVEGAQEEDFDAVVCAVPPTQAASLLSQDGFDFSALRAIEMAPIINLHLWFDRPVADFSLAAFVGNELQWAFNRDRIDPGLPGSQKHRLVVSLSAASPYMGLTRKELRERFLPQLHRAIPGTAEARLVHFLAIKEPEATFVPSPGLHRPTTQTAWPDLVLAGTFTDTGWPATMESAVRSGQAAARTLDEALAPGPHQRAKNGCNR